MSILQGCTGCGADHSCCVIDWAFRCSVGVVFVLKVWHVIGLPPSEIAGWAPSEIAR